MNKKYQLNNNKTIVALSVIIYILMFITNYLAPASYQRFLGNANPLLMYIIIPAFGIVLINILKLDGQFSIYQKIKRKKLFQILGIAILLALVPIFLVDIIIPFPKDINITFPLSLTFYPTIGFFVDMLFHVIPLLAILLILLRIFKNVDQQKIIWFSIILVALFEPIYQAKFMMADGYFPWCAIMVVCLNILVFNFIQLSLFKRYGFIMMYFFRLIYYLVWHIIWGYFRLNLLFE